MENNDKRTRKEWALAFGVSYQIMAKAVAPLPMAGATSPRESCGFQRGAAAACAKRSSGGA